MIVLDINGFLNEQKSVKGLTLYHRSHKKFDNFDLSKINSGSRRQENGWGLYFTDNLNSIKEYGDWLYTVTLFNPNLMELDNPLGKDLIIKIIASVYKHKHMDFDPNEFNSYYKHGKKIKELKQSLWDNLKKIDTDLGSVTLDEITDIKNQDAWFYIGNYTNNEKIKDIFDELTSLPNVKFNDHGLDFSVGRTLYSTLSALLGGDKAASLFLLNIGISGIKKSQSKTSNDYIIFDVNSITIEAINYKP
jgi:hypothetical protein